PARDRILADLSALTIGMSLLTKSRGRSSRSCSRRRRLAASRVHLLYQPAPSCRDLRARAAAEQLVIRSQLVQQQARQKETLPNRLTRGATNTVSLGRATQQAHNQVGTLLGRRREIAVDPVGDLARNPADR